METDRRSGPVHPTGASAGVPGQGSPVALGARVTVPAPAGERHYPRVERLEVVRTPDRPPVRSAVVVSAVSPLPVDNGKRAVLLGLVDHLVARLGPDRVHYALVAAPDEPLPALACQVHRLSTPSTREKLLDGGRRVLRDRDVTLQEALLGGERLKQDVHSLLTRLQCDLAIYDTLRLGQHRLPGAGRSVVYLDDLFSQRYARLLASAELSSDFDPLGEFVHHVPRRLRPLARRPAVYRRLLAFERRRLVTREVQVAQEFDTTLLASSTEVALLRERSRRAGVQRMSPLLPAIAPAPRRPVQPCTFVFLGRLNIPHNDDAICAFLTSAGTGLQRAFPGCTVRVIGTSPTERLQRLAAEQPGLVTLEGFVPDLADVTGTATAMLAPLRFGSGIKIKVLEALARGLPVIGTSTAFEGIDVRPDWQDGCAVEDDVRRWPHVLQRLAEPAASEAARRYFELTYSRPVVQAQYDEVLGLVAPEPSDVGASPLH